MGKRVYNKLVRDRIPEIITAEGKQLKTRILNNEEHLQALLQKLLEEYEEFKTDLNVEELADLHEVLRGLAEAIGASHDEVERVRNQKAQLRGGFSRRIFLEEAEE